MAKDGYAVFELVWDGRPIKVAYQADWLNTGHWHIELRSDAVLPVTQTGYRSQFVPYNGIADAAEVEEYVTAWLNHAATDPAWQKCLQDERQLKLF
ncbi:hypothetical protein [Falsiphaeobacter marinintestinus]|uniref:hypothetical protein n=1 Tax=Falsiphaeobacter marinintestinus TaxID=1492905 RepID=UPI0011B79345|nr:hypothetical protein [Phaeobacter marinintestinus]